MMNSATHYKSVVHTRVTTQCQEAFDLLQVEPEVPEVQVGMILFINDILNNMKIKIKIITDHDFEMEDEQNPAWLDFFHSDVDETELDPTEVVNNPRMFFISPIYFYCYIFQLLHLFHFLSILFLFYLSYIIHRIC